MLTDKLLNELVCPDCHTSLIINNDFLWCGNCQKKHYIKDNIVLLNYETDSTNNIEKEFKYWNELNNTADNLYENMPDSVYINLLHTFNLLNYSKGLELGSGDGPFAKRITNKTIKIFGLDISFPLLRLTKNLIPIRGNALKLPFKNNYFDWIIYAFALHHMPDHTKALEEAVRVLNSNGHIYIVDPNYYHPQRFLTRHPNSFFRKYVFKYFTPEERWISSSKVSKILNKNGVRIDTIKYISPEFNSKSIVSKFQKIIANIFCFPPLNIFSNSYYLIIGTKLNTKHPKTVCA